MLLCIIFFKVVWCSKVLSSRRLCKERFYMSYCHRIQNTGGYVLPRLGARYVTIRMIQYHLCISITHADTFPVVQWCPSTDNSKFKKKNLTENLPYTPTPHVEYTCAHTIVKTYYYRTCIHVRHLKFIRYVHLQCYVTVCMPYYYTMVIYYIIPNPRILYR